VVDVTRDVKFFRKRRKTKKKEKKREKKKRGITAVPYVNGRLDLCFEEKHIPSKTIGLGTQPTSLLSGCYSVALCSACWLAEPLPVASVLFR
jgi:hypothetical protein